MTTYADWFRDITGDAPYPWQAALGEEPSFGDRLLRIPTGFGKTAGTALAWLFNRCVRADDAWPRRLVFCLPMRVLVEQTERVLQEWVKKAGLDVPVVVLLGGREAARSWFEDIEKPAIVVGTQDMLLSRALNRGYASARGLWPMEFGALHSDALWVTDEVQLMDTGLATTTQLAAFRRAEAGAGRPSIRPTATWWMSATLQPSWLQSIDFADHLPSVPQMAIAPTERNGGLWAVRKTLMVRKDLTTPGEVASLVRAEHGPGTVTLVIVNTVERAKKVAEELETLRKKKDKNAASPEVRVVHSRFRGSERRGWSADGPGGFLRKKVAPPEAGRIIVATQVVEAGVDISASVLVTDLAPWSSLVQRFGRSARYHGESGRVFVVGAVPSKAPEARPYEIATLASASAALDDLAAGAADVGPLSLEQFEERLASEAPERITALYPYEPAHVLRRPDFDELFDTSADLSGADLDVGRYIRSGEDRDVTVFWRALESGEKTLAKLEWPSRDELCPVGISQIRDFLKGDKHGYVFDFLTGAWARRPADRIVPGMTVLLDASAGGYSRETGWEPSSRAPVSAIGTPPKELEHGMLEASLENDGDALSLANGYKTIRAHGHEAALEAQRLGKSLGLSQRLSELLQLAARWHDAGKAHPTFQQAIRSAARAESSLFGNRHDLAKAPSAAFARPPYGDRPGFRHELASTLMMFEVLRRKDPFHAALLGPHREVLALLEVVVVPVADETRLEAHPLADELASLTADEFDLVAYLVCAHHGKVRGRWASTPQDIGAGLGAIHGIVETTDEVPALDLPDARGAATALPALKLSLAPAAMGLGGLYGASWTDRCQRLVARLGPFTLALMEAVLRVADWRASRLPAQETP